MMSDICLFWDSPFCSSPTHRFFWVFFLNYHIPLGLLNCQEWSDRFAWRLAGLLDIRARFTSRKVETAQHLGRNLPCRKWKCGRSCNLEM